MTSIYRKDEMMEAKKLFGLCDIFRARNDPVVGPGMTSSVEKANRWLQGSFEVE